MKTVFALLGALLVCASARPSNAETSKQESSKLNIEEASVEKSRSTSLRPRVERFAGDAFLTSYDEKAGPLESEEAVVYGLRGPETQVTAEVTNDLATPTLAKRVNILTAPERLTVSSIDAIYARAYCGGSFFSGIGYLPDSLIEPSLRNVNCNVNHSTEECADRYNYSIATDIALDSKFCPTVSAFERLYKGCDSAGECPAPSPGRINRFRGFRWSTSSTHNSTYSRISPCRAASSGSGTAELFAPGTAPNCSSYPNVNSPSTTNTYRALGGWPMSIAPGGQAIVGAEAYFVAGNNFIKQQGYLWNASTNSYVMLGDMESISAPNSRNVHCAVTSGAYGVTTTANPLKIAGFGSISPDGFVDSGHLNAANRCDSWGMEGFVTTSTITADSRVVSNPPLQFPFSETVGITTDGQKALLNQYINEGGPVTPELQSIRSAIVNTSDQILTVLASSTGQPDSQVQGEAIIGTANSFAVVGQVLLGSAPDIPAAAAYSTEATIWNSNGSVFARLGRTAPGLARDCIGQEYECPSTEARDMTPSKIVVGVQFFQPAQSSSGTSGDCEYPDFAQRGSRFTYRANSAREAFIWTPTTGSAGQLRPLKSYLREQYEMRGNTQAFIEMSNWTLCEANGIYEDIGRGITAITGTGVRANSGKVEGFVAYISNDVLR